MYKILLPILLFTSFSHAQMISGDLKESGRDQISNTTYVIEGSKNGFVSYELTVNIDGIVTSTRLVAAKTSIKSTPAKVKVRNHLNTMKFEKGYHYPKFHKVVVKITIVKPI